VLQLQNFHLRNTSLQRPPAAIPGLLSPFCWRCSARAPSESILAALSLVGRSHAQHDLFRRVLLERAARDGDAPMPSRPLNARRLHKRDNSFAARIGQ
jgi:hypothetical protein